MSRLFAMILAVLAIVSASSSDAYDRIPLTEYYIKELNMTLGLPESAYVTGREVAPNFPLLEIYGVSAEELASNYEKGNIYFNAVWYDDDAEVTEILVTKEANSETMGLYHLEGADEERIEWIKQLYLNYSDEEHNGARFYDVSLVECGEIPFFRAKGTVDAEKRRNIIEYMTIVNGQKIEITMIEYLSEVESADENVRMTVSQGHEMLMDEVMETVRFDRIKNQFAAQNSGLIRIVVLSVISGVLVLIILLDYKRRLNKKQFETDTEEESLKSVDKIGTDEAAEIAQEGGSVFAEVVTVDDKTEELPEEAESDESASEETEPEEECAEEEADDTVMTEENNKD